MNEAPRSAVQRVSDALQRELARLGPGAKLRSQNELAEQYAVSRDTVQRALKELQNQGLITSIQGSGSFVSDAVEEQPEEADLLEPAIIALDHHLDRAFRERRVTIDFFGLSAETLVSLLKPRLDALRLKGRQAPEDLRIRLLLPSVDTHLAFPRSVAESQDPRPLDRLRIMTAGLVGLLDKAVTELRVRGVVANAQLDVRTVPMTPQVKLYIINGSKALRGWYKVVPNTVEVPSREGEATEELEIFDLMGLDVSLIVQRPKAMADSQEWFDSLWSLVSVEYPRKQ